MKLIKIKAYKQSMFGEATDTPETIYINPNSIDVIPPIEKGDKQTNIIVSGHNYIIATSDVKKLIKKFLGDK